MNTTKIGNEFRSHVLALLRTKYKDATTEVPVSWKNADIVFTMMDFGKRVKVAVECKYYNRKINTSDLVGICRDYEAGFNTQEISTLIIISRFDVESASKKMLHDTPRLRFLTASQLEEWLVGLRPYIEGLEGIFDTDDVSHYYIDSRVANTDSKVFSILQGWLRSDELNHNGLAVLGGYGLGKSSLAKRLAADQAKRYLRDPENERMPILLRLGQVVHETELSALFGKEFTAEHAVEGYCYSTLIHLNEHGRLLIILDGFDEMKHAMTEFDFQSNFREFNKLRTSKSKVLLLGRPNAFTSESASLLIKGIGTVAGQSFFDSDFPAWVEVNLAFFSSVESKEFLGKYLRFVQGKNGGSSDERSIDARVQEVVSDVHPDILQRPVQARIVGQLAATATYSFKHINRFRLYDDFVKRMIGRDQEKRARRIISAESRRTFLEELAWWAWIRPDTAQSVFRKDEVPQALFDRLPSGEAINNPAKRSEYLVSSLTEHKDSEVLYFAHRSFQEFLVAAAIAGRSRVDETVFMATNRAISPDVYSFLSEVENDHYLLGLFDVLSSRQVRHLNPFLLSLMQQNSKVVASILERKYQQLNQYYVAIAGSAISNSHFTCNERVKWITEVIKYSPMYAVESAIYMILIEATNLSEVIPILLAAAWERLLFGIDEKSISSIVVVDDKNFGGVGLLLRDFCTKVRDAKSAKILFFLEDAVSFLRRKNTVNGIDIPVPVGIFHESRLTYNVDIIEKLLSPTAKKLFRKVYSARSESFELVPRLTRNLRINKDTSGDNAGE